MNKCLFIHLSVHLSVCPSIHPFIHLSARPSVCLSIRPSIHPFIHLSAHLSVCLSVYLSVHPGTHSHVNYITYANTYQFTVCCVNRYYKFRPFLPDVAEQTTIGHERHNDIGGETSNRIHTESDDMENIRVIKSLHFHTLSHNVCSSCLIKETYCESQWRHKVWGAQLRMFIRYVLAITQLKFLVYNVYTDCTSILTVQSLY